MKFIDLKKVEFDKTKTSKTSFNKYSKEKEREMATTINPKPIIDIIEAMPMLQQRLNESTEAMTLYLKYLKDEKFIREENETNEESLERAGRIIGRKTIFRTTSISS